MYGYVNPDRSCRLTITSILHNVNQQEVFESLLGHQVDTDGSRYTSPFRPEDTRAGAFYTWYDGVLKFVDFADGDQIARSCIDVVMQLKKLDLPRALAYINAYYIAGNLKETTAGESPSTLEPGNSLCLRTPFELCFRHFDLKDRSYWHTKYEFTREQLASDNVFPLNWYKFYSTRKQEWFTFSPRDVAYAIMGWESIDGIPTDNIAKVYRPLAPKGEGKWTTNCSANHIGNLQNISPTGKKLRIAKAYKDCRMLRNSGIKDIVWFQNEGMIPKEEILVDLLGRYEEIDLLYDNDEAGIKAAKKLKHHLNSLAPCIVKTPTVPLRLLNEGVKDPSDLFVYNKEQYRQYVGSLVQ